jgi:hypothetical protein
MVRATGTQPVAQRQVTAAAGQQGLAQLVDVVPPLRPVQPYQRPGHPIPSLLAGQQAPLQGHRRRHQEPHIEQAVG